MYFKEQYPPELQALYYEEILAQLQRRIIPKEYPPSMQTHILNQLALKYRPDIVEVSSWSLVAYDWVRPLAQWVGNRKCLEIMCGRGVLTSALRACGTTIIATDNMSLVPERRWWVANAWIDDIEKLDCVAAVEKYAPSCDVIICSWPPADDPCLYTALLKMRAVAPNALLVYIGTIDSTINATDDFFKTVVNVNDPQFLTMRRCYRQMPGIADLPYLFK